MVETAGTVADTFGSRKEAERELKKLQARYERRGVKARNQLERDVKKARTRLERVVRRNRNAVERDAARRDNVVTDQLAGVSNRVEEAVQVGVAAAQRVGTHRQGPHRRARVAHPTSPARRRRGGAAGKPAGLISRRWDPSASYPAGGCSTLSSLNRRRAPSGRGVGLNGVEGTGPPRSSTGCPRWRRPVAPQSFPVRHGRRAHRYRSAVSLAACPRPDPLEHASVGVPVAPDSVSSSCTSD